MSQLVGFLKGVREFFHGLFLLVALFISLSASVLANAYSLHKRKSRPELSSVFLYDRGVISKMVALNDKVPCPQCLGDSRVVWLSADEKTIGIRCPRYHIQLSPPPTRWSKYNSKSKKNIVFLMSTEEFNTAFPNR